MAQQTINVGSVANDGTGDALRVAFQKANGNFSELYSTVAGKADTSVVATKAPLSSPAFTDVPTAPTAAPTANTTQIANMAAVQAAIAAYVAAQDLLALKGVIDCSTNPNYPAANAGDTYRVSVAGKIGGASGANVEAGDVLLCLLDGTSAGTHAAVGSRWGIIQVNLDGAVLLTATQTLTNKTLRC